MSDVRNAMRLGEPREEIEAPDPFARGQRIGQLFIEDGDVETLRQRVPPFPVSLTIAIANPSYPLLPTV